MFLTDEQIEDIVDKIIFSTDLKTHELCRDHYIQGMKRYREETAFNEHNKLIVKQSLHYHFSNPEGGWNIPKDMPFMTEFLNQIKKLVYEEK